MSRSATSVTASPSAAATRAPRPGATPLTPAQLAALQSRIVDAIGDSFTAARDAEQCTPDELATLLLEDVLLTIGAPAHGDAMALREKVRPVVRPTLTHWLARLRRTTG